MDDVVQGRRHPHLRLVLPMVRLRSFLAQPSRLMMRLAFSFPALGDRLAAVCEGTMPLIERARRYPTWLRVLTGLNIYWYWRGVAIELGSLDKLDEYLAAPDAAPKQVSELVVRLEEGVAAAAARLDAARPAAAVLCYGDRLVGRIPALPGTERLAGRHLAPLLATVFRAPLTAALAEATSTGFPELDARLRELAELLMRGWQEPEWRV